MLTDNPIIEGRNPVIEALRAGHPINKVLLASNAKRQPAIAEILDLSRVRKVPVEYVERRFLDRLAVASSHQGVVAYASVKEYIGLDDLLAISSEKGEAPLYCILDGIEDPHNLGAILRTAEA
ncbi:MAG: rRNA ((2251)-2'-O)-methyltransferase RlmB, partial [Dehalococcoidia bacterium]|nr:rRNA ((2251)-2'-O)-methyltransferase RlmB [Dehalococcoidia bacterium]